MTSFFYTHSKNLLALLLVSVFIYVINYSFSKDYDNYRQMFTKHVPITLNVCEEPGRDKCISPDQFIRGTNALYPGDMLPSGVRLFSLDRKFHLVMGTDGILVIYDESGAPLWFVATLQKRAYLKFEEDGNLVINTADHQRLWQSNTQGSNANFLVMHSNGNLVLYSNEKVIWDSSSDRMKIDSYREPGFLGLMKLFANFGSFNLFLFVVIFFSFALKFYAFEQIKPQLNLMNFLPYLAVLSFLHEGVQIRIAIALSLALLAIIFYIKSRKILATLFLLSAISFHVTTLIFALLALADYVCRKIGKGIALVLTVILLGVAMTPIFSEMMIQLMVAINPNFVAYFNGDTLTNQNKSGLFQYFFIFVGGLTLVNSLFHRAKNSEWARLKDLATLSGVMAVVILLVLKGNVIIASRLAEILLLPILLVLGETLCQLRESKRNGLLFLIIAGLLLYMLLRSYVVFG